MARGLDSKHWAKKSCHSSKGLAASAIFGPPEQTLHSLGLGVCAPINSIAAALLLVDSLERNVDFYRGNVDFFEKVSNETLFFCTATLIFYDSLERNAHFYRNDIIFYESLERNAHFVQGNVDFL